MQLLPTLIHDKKCALCIVLIIMMCSTVASPLCAQQFAATITQSSGLGSNSLYNDPNALLGQPTTSIANGDGSGSTYHASMVFPAFNTDPGGNDLIDVLGTSGTVTVKFSTPITHDSTHWYGQDFIVYGNSRFTDSSGFVGPETDMSKVDIVTGQNIIYQNGVPGISVSPDGVNYTAISPSGLYYPENPFAWAGISAQNPSGWNDAVMQDFSKPVNPSVPASAFSGQTVTTALNTYYLGSAGGASFSLLGLTDSYGSPLNSIQYIQFTGTGGSSCVDAVARVEINPASVPEPDNIIDLLIGISSFVLLAFDSKRRQNWTA